MKLSFLIAALLTISTQAKVLKSKDNRVVIDDLKTSNLYVGDRVHFKSHNGQITGSGNIIKVRKKLALVQIDQGYAHKNYRVLSSVTPGEVVSSESTIAQKPAQSPVTFGVHASLARHRFTKGEEGGFVGKRDDLENKDDLDMTFLELGLDVDYKISGNLGMSTSPTIGLNPSTSEEESENGLSLKEETTGNEIKLTQKITYDIALSNIVLQPYALASIGRYKEKTKITASFEGDSASGESELKAKTQAFGIGAKLKFESKFFAFAEFQQKTLKDLEYSLTGFGTENSDAELKFNYLRLGVGYTF